MVLVTYGFTLNPYDPCMVNKLADGHQIKVIWHLNIMKFSHKGPFDINIFAQYQSHGYGKR